MALRLRGLEPEVVVSIDLIAAAVTLAAVPSGRAGMTIGAGAGAGEAGVAKAASAAGGALTAAAAGGGCRGVGLRGFGASSEWPRSSRSPFISWYTPRGERIGEATL